MRGLPRSHAKHVQRKTALFDDGLAQKSCEACTTQKTALFDDGLAQKSCEACTSGPVAQSVRAPLL
ncbi:MAG: hypothetical protein UT02_C0018G0012 [Parcubacteria group bacterium GW2011_GWC2_38_7]|nr:MAG: hypothetical protein UT02_C0018G0012 [Parcubacteria group bacterium GW2011_GWC2_38_7]